VTRIQRLTTTICFLLSFACAGRAAAQGVSMLNPIAPTYTLLGFVYTPPKTDGWRELTSQPDAVRIVYAEQLDPAQINTRADFTVQSFPIDAPAKVPDAITLTQLSMSQRLDEKKQETATEVVAISRPQQLVGEVPTFEYELRLKVNGEEVFEDYFVALAPDKSQYLAAKMVTKDKDFRELPYFKPLQDSMTALKFPGAAPLDQQSSNGSASASTSAPSPKPADTAPAPPTAVK
jgi:hypothetical protein